MASADTQQNPIAAINAANSPDSSRPQDPNELMESVKDRKTLRAERKAARKQRAQEAGYAVRKIHDKKVAERNAAIDEFFQHNEDDIWVTKASLEAMKLSSKLTATFLDEMFKEPIAKIARAHRLRHAMKRDGVTSLTQEYIKANDKVLPHFGKEARIEQNLAAENAKTISKTQEVFKKLAEGDTTSVRDQAIDKAVETQGKPFIDEITKEVLAQLVQSATIGSTEINSSDFTTAKEAVAKILEHYKDNAAAQGLSAGELALGLVLAAKEMKARGAVLEDRARLDKAFDNFIYGTGDESARRQIGLLAKGELPLKALQIARPAIMAAVGIGLAINPPLALVVVGATIVVTQLHRLQLDRAMRQMDAARGLKNIRAKQEIDGNWWQLKNLMATTGNWWNVDWEQIGFANAVDVRKKDVLGALASRVGLGVACNVGAFMLGHIAGGEHGGQASGANSPDLRIVGGAVPESSVTDPPSISDSLLSSLHQFDTDRAAGILSGGDHGGESADLNSIMQGVHALNDPKLNEDLQTFMQGGQKETDLQKLIIDTTAYKETHPYEVFPDAAIKAGDDVDKVIADITNGRLDPQHYDVDVAQADAALKLLGTNGQGQKLDADFQAALAEYKAGHGTDALKAFVKQFDDLKPKPSASAAYHQTALDYRDKIISDLGEAKDAANARVFLDKLGTAAHDSVSAVGNQLQSEGIHTNEWTNPLDQHATSGGATVSAAAHETGNSSSVDINTLFGDHNPNIHETHTNAGDSFRSDHFTIPSNHPEDATDKALGSWQGNHTAYGADGQSVEFYGTYPGAQMEININGHYYLFDPQTMHLGNNDAVILHPLDGSHDVTMTQNSFLHMVGYGDPKTIEAGYIINNDLAQWAKSHGWTSTHNASDRIAQYLNGTLGPKHPGLDNMINQHLREANIQRSDIHYTGVQMGIAIRDGNHITILAQNGLIDKGAFQENVNINSGGDLLHRGFEPTIAGGPDVAGWVSRLPLYASISLAALWYGGSGIVAYNEARRARASNSLGGFLGHTVPGASAITALTIATFPLVGAGAAVGGALGLLRGGGSQSAPAAASASQQNSGGGGGPLAILRDFFSRNNNPPAPSGGVTPASSASSGSSATNSARPTFAALMPAPGKKASRQAGQQAAKIFNDNLSDGSSPVTRQEAAAFLPAVQSVKERHPSVRNTPSADLADELIVGMGGKGPDLTTQDKASIAAAELMGGETGRIPSMTQAIQRRAIADRIVRNNKNRDPEKLVTLMRTEMNTNKLDGTVQTPEQIRRQAEAVKRTLQANRVSSDNMLAGMRAGFPPDAHVQAIVAAELSGKDGVDKMAAGLKRGDEILKANTSGGSPTPENRAKLARAMVEAYGGTSSTPDHVLQANRDVATAARAVFPADAADTVEASLRPTPASPAAPEAVVSPQEQQLRSEFTQAMDEFGAAQVDWETAKDDPQKTTTLNGTYANVVGRALKLPEVRGDEEFGRLLTDISNADLAVKTAFDAFQAEMGTSTKSQKQSEWIETLRALRYDQLDPNLKTAFTTYMSRLRAKVTGAPSAVQPSYSPPNPEEVSPDEAGAVAGEVSGREDNTGAQATPATDATLAPEDQQQADQAAASPQSTLPTANGGAIITEEPLQSEVGATAAPTAGERSTIETRLASTVEPSLAESQENKTEKLKEALQTTYEQFEPVRRKYEHEKGLNTPENTQLKADVNTAYAEVLQAMVDIVIANRNSMPLADVVSRFGEFASLVEKQVIEENPSLGVESKRLERQQTARKKPFNELKDDARGKFAEALTEMVKALEGTLLPNESQPPLRTVDEISAQEGAVSNPIINLSGGTDGESSTHNSTIAGSTNDVDSLLTPSAEQRDHVEAPIQLLTFEQLLPEFRTRTEGETLLIPSQNEIHGLALIFVDTFHGGLANITPAVAVNNYVKLEQMVLRALSIPDEASRAQVLQHIADEFRLPEIANVVVQTPQEIFAEAVVQTMELPAVQLTQIETMYEDMAKFNSRQHDSSLSEEVRHAEEVQIQNMQNVQKQVMNEFIAQKLSSQDINPDGIPYLFSFGMSEELPNAQRIAELVDYRFISSSDEAKRVWDDFQSFVKQGKGGVVIKEGDTYSFKPVQRDVAGMDEEAIRQQIHDLLRDVVEKEVVAATDTEERAVADTAKAERQTGARHTIEEATAQAVERAKRLYPGESMAQFIIDPFADAFIRDPELDTKINLKPLLSHPMPFIQEVNQKYHDIAYGENGPKTFSALREILYEIEHGVDRVNDVGEPLSVDTTRADEFVAQGLLLRLDGLVSQLAEDKIPLKQAQLVPLQLFAVDQGLFYQYINRRYGISSKTLQDDPNIEKIRLQILRLEKGESSAPILYEKVLVPFENGLLQIAPKVQPPGVQSA